jgi:hypothetical protein
MLYTIVSLSAQALLLSHLCLAQAQGTQHVLTAEPRLRKATLNYADDIATIVIAAFEPILDWQYFP